MAQNSKIEWTTHTANLWWGCTEVHAGCDNCYARTLAHRWGFDIWGKDKPRREIQSVWKDLERYQKVAAAASRVDRVFVGSMMDIFEKPMPLVDGARKPVTDIVDGDAVTTGDLRDHFFKNVCNAPNLLFLLLTKRPSNINKYIPKDWLTNPPDNVMFGTSPVDQKTCDKLIPQLLKVKGKRFLSVEPMLEAVKFTGTCCLGCGRDTRQNCDCPAGTSTYFLYNVYDAEPVNPWGIDWVIVGGESGAGRRPFNPDWARSLKSDCKAAGVPFFFKQVDKVMPIPEDLRVREFPKL